VFCTLNKKKVMVDNIANNNNTKHSLDICVIQMSLPSEVDLCLSH